MFDEKELQETLKACREMETIRVTYEDGHYEECRANIWHVIGLNTMEKKKIRWGKVCVEGGMDVLADVVMQLAMLENETKDLRKVLMQSSPLMTEAVIEASVLMCKTILGVENA